MADAARVYLASLFFERNESADRLPVDLVLLADDCRLRNLRMVYENVTHMSGTSVTYVPSL